MVSKNRMRFAGLLVGGLAVVPVVALASHGKAGLWEVTSTMSMPGLPQVSPQQAAQMQAMGVQMPANRTSTTQRCMTPTEVASESPPPPRNKSCVFSNVKLAGGTFSGDETCSGDFDGQGHFSVTYDSDSHYSGTSTLNGTAHGHPVNVNNSFEGRWVSADCGSVK
jgi:hypothetical protein